jgi:hypothetical protein
MLPIPDRPLPGLTTYDAKDPDIAAGNSNGDVPMLHFTHPAIGPPMLAANTRSFV